MGSLNSRVLSVYAINTAKLGYDYISKKGTGYQTNKQYFFSANIVLPETFCMEACQATPATLSCFYPVLYPKDTANVTVFQLPSNPPELSISIIPQSLPSVFYTNLKFNPELQKKYFYNFSSTKPFDKVCPQC